MQALRTDQLEAATRTLATAFWEDPLFEIIAPDEKRRATAGPWFLEKGLAYGLRWGRVYANEDVSAVAAWLPPGESKMTPLRMLRVGMGALPFKAGLSGLSRVGKAMAATEKFHKAVKEPHWYLMAIGTLPERQGSGLGTALVELGTSQADAAGVPCYLETGTESNVAFYTRRGFKVTGEANVLGFTLYGMVRPPA